MIGPGTGSTWQSQQVLQVHFQDGPLHLLSFESNLLAAVVAFAVTGIACNKLGRSGSDQGLVYTIDAGVRWMMLFCSLFMMSVAYWPGASGSSDPNLFFWKFAPFWMLSLAMACYVSWYRITLDDAMLTVRTKFPVRTIVMSMVIDFDFKKNGRGQQELLLYLADGSKIHISGMLSDFHGLCAVITRTVDGHGEHADSAAKLADLRGIEFGKKRGFWIAALSLPLIALLALLVFILSQG